MSDTFSPYLDPEPWAEWWEDFARRNTLAIFIAFIIHVAFFFMIQPSFVVPDLLPDEPETIPIQIVAFEELQPEPISEPEPVISPPPVAAPPPTVKPKPKPRPAPPPPPPPEPEPEPEPVIAPPPPPPDILAQPTPEPVQDTLPEPSPPVPAPQPVPEPQLVPEPQEVYSQEPPGEWRPYTPPQPDPPEPEPLPEPEPDPLPEPEPIIEIFEPEPLPEPLPEPEAIPTPGIIEELPELPDIEELPPLPTPEPVAPTPAPPAPVIEETLDPEDDEEEDGPISTAPTILASPDAPISQQEADRAIPESQAAPIEEFLFKPSSRPGSGQPSTGLSRPSGSSGLGRPSTGSGNPGGTRRANPGASGWRLTPPGGTDVGAGYKGLVLDIRCREAGRTHEDCPEYLRQFAGRNASGFESFSPHASQRTVGGTQATRRGVSGLGTVQTGAQGGRGAFNGGLGNNSYNAGGPSTTVLDDTTFSHGFQGLGAQDDTSTKLRDLFDEPDRPWDEKPILLPSPKDEEDE